METPPFNGKDVQGGDLESVISPDADQGEDGGNDKQENQKTAKAKSVTIGTGHGFSPLFLVWETVRLDEPAVL